MNDVEDFLSYLLTDKGYSDKTIHVYRDTLESVESFYQVLDEQITWQTLHQDVVRQWVASRMEKAIQLVPFVNALVLCVHSTNTCCAQRKLR